MNDYKGLIGNLLRHYPDKYWALQAALAIKQLVEERDAAYNDISHNCKTCGKEHGIMDALDRLQDGKCDEWEWRGVQEVCE